MKKILISCGIVAVIFVLLAGAGITYMAKKGGQLDNESKAFVDEKVLEFIKTWNKQIILDNASKELLAVITEEEIDKLIEVYKKLGALKGYYGAEGSSLVNYNNQGKTISAEYTAKADFENGLAEIKVKLVKREGKWFLKLFLINSKVFLDYMQPSN